ncbi:MAG: restriction endonuclease [Anaerolineaceae bacterium]|nr:restriction endonuclease [Anaerolineaceae bacterium]
MIAYMQILFPAFDILFDFWLFLIIAPLKYRRSGVRNMLYAWVLLAIIRVILIFNPNSTILSWMIPEPWNTNLFVVTGIILVLILFLWKSNKTKKLRKKMFGLSARDLLEVNPGEFEEMTAELFRASGYKAKRTGMSGDHGVDVLIKTKEGQKVIVQCKRWRKPVGEPLVRDFYGAMQHEKAAHGVIFGTSGFTQQAMDWAKGKPISLYDGNKFISMWKKAKKSENKNKTAL